MRAASSIPWLRVAGLCWGLWAAQAGGAQNTATVTNLLQLRQLDSRGLNPRQAVQFEVTGQLCWVSSTGQQLALLDGADGSVLEIAGYSLPPLRPGQLVRLSGLVTLSKRGGLIGLGNELLVVDNDGMHALTEKSGSVFLKAGRRPIRLEWFNGWGASGLTLEYEGPNRPRRRVSDTELFRLQADTTNWVNGLDYRQYTCWGGKLPWFSRMQPDKTGTCSNFDLGELAQKSRVALQFSGSLEVPSDGVYKFYLASDDGSRLFVGASDLHLNVEVLGAGELPVPRQLFAGQVLGEEVDGCWAVVEGKVTGVEREREGLRLQLAVGLARMEVKAADVTVSAASLLNSLVRAVGFCQCAYDADGLKAPRLLLVSSLGRLEVLKPSPASLVKGAASLGNTNSVARLPLLTTAAEVDGLKREEAQLGYPVKVRGVVTSIDGRAQAFTFRDSTRGLYVSQAEPVEIGEYVEVEGVTDAGEFAPVLKATGRVQHLGPGQMPEPVRPGWDQLMNGSLDGEYVELEGIVASTNGAEVALLTPSGLLPMDLAGGAPGEQAKENALVRIRGTLFARWNPETHQVKPGHIGLFNFTVRVEKPPPKDLFDAPSKTPAELLQFDSQASMFQRVRISGQIVHLGEETSFMMARSSGVRFIAENASTLQIGDLVEVAGYPELGGVSPLLRKAVARKTGHRALPTPRALAPGQLLQAEYDSTLVRVAGVLVEARETPQGGVLEMVDGTRGFVARLSSKKGLWPSLPGGSRLALTGVYRALGGNNASPQRITSFELLLDSPADIRILERPSWWTLKRLLVVTGALLCVLAGAGLWITQLRRQVGQRSRELEVQIRERERIEQHRVMEQERARIARDLHDELGSGLTEIRMLATTAARDRQESPQQVQIASRSGQMVRALDEIVWAMNPKHDSLRSLGSYFCLYADRFLKLANVRCRLRGTLELPDQPLEPLHRHECFLAFKEALTNIVRHSGATEARLDIRCIGSRLRLSLTDNGEGLKSAKTTEEMDGLANMRERIEKIGGRFSLTSLPGRGTTLRFYLPLR